MDRADIQFEQRVRYIGTGLPAYTGRTGVVEGQSENGFVFVRLDRVDAYDRNERTPLVAMMPHNLEPVEEQAA